MFEGIRLRSELFGHATRETVVPELVCSLEVMHAPSAGELRTLHLFAVKWGERGGPDGGRVDVDYTLDEMLALFALLPWVRDVGAVPRVK